MASYILVTSFALFASLQTVVNGYSFSLVAHFTKPTFSNETKNTLRAFAPLQDLRDLELCHILPFSVMDKKLALVFLDQWDKLKAGEKVRDDVFNDLKLDAYKVDGEAAYLKSADVKSKMNFYHENANQRRRLEEEFSKLKLVRDPKSTAYSSMLQTVLDLLYNAPANLRVSSESCINEGPAMDFEDPNLRTYSETPHHTLNDTEFTEHSRYLARKYNLSLIKDRHGLIRTTDKKKSDLNPSLPNSLKEYNKGLNVFQFFTKNGSSGTESNNDVIMRKRGKIDHGN